MEPFLPPPSVEGDLAGGSAQSLLHAGDVARANLMSMASPVSGESFIVSTGVDTSLNEIVKILGRLTNNNVEPQYHTDPNKPRTASVFAFDDVEVLYLPAEEWLRFLYKHPRAMHAQWATTAERTEQAVKKIALFGSRPSAR